MVAQLSSEQTLVELFLSLLNGNELLHCSVPDKGDRRGLGVPRRRKWQRKLRDFCKRPVLVALSMTWRPLGLKGHPGRWNNLMNGTLCEITNILVPLGLETTQEEGLFHLDFALCGAQTSVSIERKKKMENKEVYFPVAGEKQLILLRIELCHRNRNWLSGIFEHACWYRGWTWY